jgi:hypothetical protein
MSASIPPGAPPNEPREFSTPVAWLFGRALIASLKSIALYTAYGDKLDHKDWMTPNQLRLADETLEDGAFWFDYLADSGDGQMATYSIAYLCLSELWAQPVKDAKVSFDNPSDGSRRLPRGRFLFVGGDTAYHVADYPTLAYRFQRPFIWAFEDLEAAGKITREPRRPLLGIPGNHDYYDSLDGFNRQFRHPFNPGTATMSATGHSSGPQLSIPGFQRLQQASYVAMELPFDWWFWGLDTQEGQIDVRQKDWFEKCRLHNGCHKLIVATPEPSTAFGKRADPNGALCKTFQKLGLPLAFLDPNGQLPPGECRLDLSGDVHHYNRYWGEGAGPVTPGAPVSPHYASVVSGLGGAFLHPSQTDFHEITPQEVYPSPTTSAGVFARCLLNPFHILGGGYIWLIGALLAALLYFGVTASPGPQALFQMLLSALGTSAPAAAQPTRLLGVVSNELAVPAPKQALPWLPSEASWLVVLLLAVGAIQSLMSLITEQGNQAVTGKSNQAVNVGRYWAVFPLLSVAAGIEGRIWNLPAPGCRPFTYNLILMLFLGVSGWSLVWARRYENWRFNCARQRYRRAGDPIPTWFFVVFGFTTAAQGILRYGIYPVALFTADMLFTLAALGVLLGLCLYAWFAGAGMLAGSQKAGLVLLGLFHAVLQVSVPTLLAAIGSDTAAGLVLAAAVVFFGIGHLVKKQPWLLAVAWLVYGATVLSLPFLFPGNPTPSVGRLARAIAFGTLFAGVWLGWYFLVCLGFNGHNNEAGGAGRVGSFKEFIRFRVTEQDVTGFVIAVDEPQPEGSRLQPRLVDVFRIRS